MSRISIEGNVKSRSGWLAALSNLASRAESQFWPRPNCWHRQSEIKHYGWRRSEMNVEDDAPPQDIKHKYHIRPSHSIDTIDLRFWHHITSPKVWWQIPETAGELVAMSTQLMAAAAAEMYFLKKRDNFGCVNLSGCTQQTVAAAAEVYCLYCSL